LLLLPLFELFCVVLEPVGLGAATTGAAEVVVTGGAEVVVTGAELVVTGAGALLVAAWALCTVAL
jgi:hypothetical protein